MDIKKMQEKPPYGMIAILFIGAFVALLNNTLLNVALPTIMVEFDVKPSVVQWLTTGYMLINGILIPASAFFIQKFTNRKIVLNSYGAVYSRDNSCNACTIIWCTRCCSNDSSVWICHDDAASYERYADGISN